MEGIDRQSLLALILFYLECRVPNSNALDWFEGNYASVLYSDARMDDQRISEVLSVLGKEETKSVILRNTINGRHSKPQSSTASTAPLPRSQATTERGSMALLDAGYCTTSIIRKLMTMKISFITRLNAKMVLLRNLENNGNLIRYEESFFYIRMFRSAMKRSMPMSAWTKHPMPITP